ncbi:hypothetical protein GCM10010981_07900 [Dyella nitratireducens]|uniref:Uncharacterized protein n=2 Tax=Dyella nitratireducens TaxID=1849580 RepID=A0ABQ1FM56_9GAMM|nr:hypothetical protein GCM10010981_07900 [Dyella nitratireducens]GLQ44150.1 hypothetical protein GCM10007902_40000 [Dyella nitratireducens]
MCRFAPRLRQTDLILGLGLALGLTATSASAQTEVVIDPSAIAQSITNLGEELAQMQKLWQLGQDQLNQLVSTIDGLRNLSPGFSSPALQSISDSQRNDLIRMNCKTTSGGLIGSALDALFSSSSSIQERQQAICAQIVATQIDKYNLTVEMLKNVEQQSNFFTEIAGIIGNIKSIADSGRIAAHAQSYSNALTTDMANWRTQMDAKDAIIRNLQAQQAVLGRAALNGNGASDAISTGVLLGVLQGLK